VFSTLSREERLRLMRFICSVAWADLKVRPEEREFALKLVDRLGLQADEIEQVKGWLEVPPRADDVDPEQIPRSHRALFLHTLRELVVADGEVDAQEQTSIDLLETLLGVSAESVAAR
jgi:uncharacterized tellurite resistance protein B-like protein